MVNVFSAPKKKEENNENVKQTTKQETSPAPTEQTATLFQKLKIEEAQLFEERQNLAQQKQQLQKKIKDQIETRKTNLQKLKTEVSDLKIEVAQLNESLQGEVLAE
jgi:predicted transcriptional regulator